jgi:Tfp pilus assembly protein PilO
MIISPLTIIAFVVWIEWWINNDGPSQENPQQVGQWSSLVSIALLLVSAAILSLKYRLATTSELDTEIEKTKTHLENLQQRRDARSQLETVALTASAGPED